ncbi:TPA: hypothetical protein ACPZMX_003079 [Yersinia enterocolitica]
MTVIFSSETQQNSEIAYAEWLANNPKGFVLNRLKAASGIPTKNDEDKTFIHKLLAFSSNRRKKVLQRVIIRSCAPTPMKKLKQWPNT